MKKKAIKISGLFLILLFAFNYASSNFFFHTHTVDSVKINHSHPYQTTDGHQHSSSALDFYSSILRTLYNTISFIFVPLLILVLIAIFTQQVNVLCSKEIKIDRIPRAPPII